MRGGDPKPGKMGLEVFKLLGFDFPSIVFTAIRLDTVQPAARKSLDSEAAIGEFVPNLGNRAATLEPPVTGSRVSNPLSILSGVFTTRSFNRTELFDDPCFVRFGNMAPPFAEMVCRRTFQIVGLAIRVVLPNEADRVNKGSGLN